MQLVAWPSGPTPSRLRPSHWQVSVATIYWDSSFAKRPSSNGTGRQVEGPVALGMTAVIVEDVVTSGGSALKAVDAAREFGLKVDRIFGGCRSLGGGREAIEAAGLKLQTLVTVRDLGIEA
ncbi:MAG: hypothetical protein R3C56_35100 [Pirellulaceae bacterium]